MHFLPIMCTLGLYQFLAPKSEFSALLPGLPQLPQLCFSFQNTLELIIMPNREIGYLTDSKKVEISTIL